MFKQWHEDCSCLVDLSEWFMHSHVAIEFSSVLYSLWQMITRCRKLSVEKVLLQKFYGKYLLEKFC